MSEMTLSYHSSDELRAEAAEALLRWALALADTKHRLGLRNSEWVNGTPALEAAVGASALTQDELGHARSYFAFLREFPGAPDALGFENDLESRDEFYCPRILETPWESWLDMIAVNVLLDRALSIAVEATRDSVYGPLHSRSGKILQEERFHRIFGDSWLARLAARDDDVPARLQEAIDTYWPTALAWIGPDDDRITMTLYSDGVLNATPDEMRRRWLEQVTSLLEKNGLRVPDTSPDWANWDDAYRDIQRQ